MGDFLDGREDLGDLSTDVCIVGAGAAGISLALELADAPFDVVLVESGGLKWEAEYQDLYRGKQIGVPTDALHVSRLRHFGGTTGHWGGWCRPYDAIDFERRSWVPHSGWPFGREELDSYYQRACELCQIDNSFDANELTRDEDKRNGLLQHDEHFENVVFQVSPPTRFGTLYREELERIKNLRVLLHSSVVDFDLDASATTVIRAKVKTLNERSFAIKAKRFVIAAGAIESARILLGADRDHKTGLGNANDLVGRFFQQHVSRLKLRWVAASPNARALFFRPSRNLQARIVVRAAPALQRKHELLQYHFLRSAFSDDGTQNVGNALRQLYQEMLQPVPIERAVRRLIAGVDADVSGNHSETTYSAMLTERPEQAPNPASRIRISNDLDALGQRRTLMDWQLTELDVHTIRKMQNLTVKYLGERGLGRLKGWVDDYDPRDSGKIHAGFHHMGTLRMSANSTQGVVDQNCRMHDLKNLWIAGSATFPTSSYANPTLTIVAMSVRLARMLRAQV